MTSNEAIEMNAPHIDINAGDRVDMTGPTVWIDNNGVRHSNPDPGGGDSQCTIKMYPDGGRSDHSNHSHYNDPKDVAGQSS